MLGFCRTACFALILTIPAFAIEVGTSVASVSHEGSSETVGSITMTLVDDDLAHASPDTPIYIRVGLSQSRGWSRTLVDPRAGSDIDDPINIALYPTGDTEIYAGTPENAVQLVRMVAGESFAWLKVTHSSSTWTVSNGSPAPPSGSRPVAMTIGIRGNASVNIGSNTPSRGNEYASTHLLADTRLKADYRGTPGFNNGDLETVGLIAFDHETSGVEDGFPVAGNNTGIGFSNDFVVARAVNFFPCFEYHFIEGDFDSPAHDVVMNHLDLVQRRNYEVGVPEIFLTNSSDFAWEPGSSFYVTHDTYIPTYEVFDTDPPHSYAPSVPTTHLIDATLTLTTDSEAVFSVEQVHYNDTLMGYKINLVDGAMAPFTYLKVEGLRVHTEVARNATEAESLRLSAWAYYKAQGVNPTPEVEELGPLSTLTANFTIGSAPHQAVLAYAPWDRPDLDFAAYIVNPNPYPVRYTTIIYHPFGLLQEVLGSRTLAPYARERILFLEWPEDKAKLGWMAVYSEAPLTSTGLIFANNLESLDVYGESKELSDVLYGPHITQGQEWETRAYMVSADSDVDPTFTFRFPGEVDERRVDGFIIPNGTGAVGEEDFALANTRPTWFEVNSASRTGAGLMLYRTTENNDMLASVPMTGKLERLWTYEHVGNNANGWFNGVVMMNPGEAANAVTIRGYNTEGALIESVSVEVPPQSRAVGQLSQFFGAGVSVARLEVEGTEPIVSFLLLGRVEGDRMTTIPGNLTPHEDLVLGLLPTDTSYWVGLALVNQGASETAVRLIPYTEQGEAGNELVVTVPANQKRLISVFDEIELSDDYTHMMIRASEPIIAYALTGDYANHQLATIPLEEAPVETND